MKRERERKEEKMKKRKRKRERERETIDRHMRGKWEPGDYMWFWLFGEWRMKSESKSDRLKNRNKNEEWQ